MKLRNALYLFTSTCLFMPAFAQVAHADAPDSAPAANTAEIIVTAQKRAENIRDVPITITALDNKALANANVTDVQGLTTIVAGFTGPGDLAFTSPHIRGVGSQVGGPGLETSVATYVDGIYIGAPSPALLKLNAVEQIEVLKGPQGTLFGRNTTGGVIQIQTRNPGKTFDAAVETGYGNFDTYTGNAYVNIPVSSNVSTNFSGSATGSGRGWGTNYTIAQTGPNAYALSTNGATQSYKLNSNVVLRNKWNIDFGGGTTLMLIGDYEHRSSNGFFNYRPVTGSPVGIGTGTAYISTVGGWDTAAPESADRSDAWGLAARLAHDFGSVVVTNTLAYRDTKFDVVNFSADRLAAVLDDNHFYWYTSDKQWTDELQLSSKGNGPFKWTAGLFYYNAVDITHQPESTGNVFNIPFASATDTHTTTSAIAGYGQASYEVASGTTLTVGLRYSSDHHEQTGSFGIFTDNTFAIRAVNLVENAPAFTKGSLSGRVSIAHKFDEDAMIYASYNRGSKSGGFNPVHIGQTPVDTGGNPFLDEKVNAYEIGTKLRFLNRMATFNLSGFYYDYKNIQIQAFFGGPPIIYNGPSAKLYGADADLTVRPTDQLTLSGNLEVMHSEFGNFPGAQLYTAIPVAGGFSAGTFNAQGNSVPLAPDVTATASANYKVPTSFGTFDLNGNLKYTSKYYFSVGEEFSQPATTMLGASIQYTTADNRFFARIWGSNLTNKLQAGSGSISTSSEVVTMNAPREYGLTFGVKFN